LNTTIQIYLPIDQQVVPYLFHLKLTRIQYTTLLICY